MRMRVLIVDDEPLAREGIKLMLSSDSQVMEARNGREAVAKIRDETPDLVLLDVQMPRMDGFAVVEAVGADKMPVVIFVTAHDQYAIRAFEINAVDYLLKPVTEERFRLAFERARNRLRAASPNESTSQMLAVLDAIANPRQYLSRLAVRSGDRTIFLAIDEVEWIEAAQNYVRVHAGQATHLLHVPMNTIETSLDPERFVRVHRSHIVNLQSIKHLWTLAHGQYILELISGERLQSSRSCLREDPDGHAFESILTSCGAANPGCSRLSAGSGVSTFSAILHPSPHYMWGRRFRLPTRDVLPQKTFPTGIPISPGKPFCLSPGVWPAPCRGPDCCTRPPPRLYPRGTSYARDATNKTPPNMSVSAK